MTVALQSLLTVNRFVLAGLLVTASVGAIAQTAVSPQGDAGATASSPQARSPGHHMGRYDPAQMQAYMAKRQADMKAKLKITPAQEGAWTAFTAAMHAPTSMMGSRPGAEPRAEFDKLTTPQRIDKMRELRTERIAEMDKRMDATKTFYAALNAEQQKVFDAEHATRGRHHGAGHGGSYGGGHGGGHHGGMEHGKS